LLLKEVTEVDETGMLLMIFHGPCELNTGHSSPEAVYVATEKPPEDEQTVIVEEPPEPALVLVAPWLNESDRESHPLQLQALESRT
jgi:hypothetical protein